MKTNAILFIYGVGGHKEQMKRFLKLLDLDNKFKKIALIENNGDLDLFDELIQIPPARDKYNSLKTILTAPYFVLYSIYTTFRLIFKYNTKVLISTGPGLAFIPSIIFRVLGKKVIFIETWSRFNTQSLTGKMMYKIANIFYIQNESLKNIYPNAIYSGRL